MKAKIEVIELTRTELCNLLSDGLCGSDWLGADYKKSVWNNIPSDKKDGDCFEDHLVDLLVNGYPIQLVDLEQSSDDNTETLIGNKGRFVKNNGDWNTSCKYIAVYDVDLKDIFAACGSEEGYGYAMEEFVAETGDYYTANNLLQIAMFGEVVYG